MRSFLFSILFLFIPKLAISQVSANDKITYLDSIGKETIEGQHHHYRIVKDYYLDQKEYKFLEYYKNDKLKSEKTLSGKDGGRLIGEEKEYYVNGNLQSIANYKDGRRSGKYLCFYENGNKKEEGEYIDNKKSFNDYKLNQYWDENNNHSIIDGNGAYSCVKKEYSETGLYKNGYKDGLYEGKFFTDNSSFSENYENGKLISGVRNFADNTKSEYFEVEKPAQPQKGMKDFYNFVGRNFKVPETTAGGKIMIQFYIEKDGEIVEPLILRSIDYDTDKEAIRILLKYSKDEKFSPAEQRGEKVRQKFVLPIMIQSPAYYSNSH